MSTVQAPVKYIQHEGAAFREGTDVEVMKILRKLASNHRNTRIRIFYGDTKTGRDWCESHDVMGYVGLSAGEVKVPLLIANSTSYGGTAISTQSIVKITVDKKVIYEHPKYLTPKTKVERAKVKGQQGYVVVVQTHPSQSPQVLAQCATQEKAEHFAAFIRGERNKW